MINIYIDSNYKGLKGVAEYGYLLEWERAGEIKKLSEIEILTIDDTRNRAYMTVAIKAFERIAIKDPVRVYVTNDYLAGSMGKGLPEFWMWQGWIRGDGAEVKNRDLWIELTQTIKGKELPLVEWVSGIHKYSEKITRKIEDLYGARRA